MSGQINLALYPYVFIGSQMRFVLMRHRGVIVRKAKRKKYVQKIAHVFNNLDFAILMYVNLVAKVAAQIFFQMHHSN